MSLTCPEIIEAVRKCLVKAGSTFRQDQFDAYQRAIAREKNKNARWVLEQLVANARIAAQRKFPLCDDTGLPHVLAEIGQEVVLPAGWLQAVQQGVALGLRDLPGRPMAVKGDDVQRMEQSKGLYSEPGRLDLAPVIALPARGRRLGLTVMLLGGGPEIRAKTRRVFHRRSIDRILEEAASWIAAEAGSLGCTPLVLAMGMGRSQVEASAMMFTAMAKGSLNKQSPLESKVTDIINKTQVGPLGLGGGATSLGTFLKIGPARASGVRIVSVRPCCCVEPRRAAVKLG